VAVFEAGNGLKRRAMKSKNINVSDSAEQANETAYRERERLSGADLGKTRGGFLPALLLERHRQKTKQFMTQSRGKPVST